MALAVSKEGDAGFPDPTSRRMSRPCPRYEVEALWFCVLLVSMEKLHRLHGSLYILQQVFRLNHWQH